MNIAHSLSFSKGEEYMFLVFRFKLELVDGPLKAFEAAKNGDGVILFGL